MVLLEKTRGLANLQQKYLPISEIRSGFFYFNNFGKFEFHIRSVSTSNMHFKDFLDFSKWSNFKIFSTIFLDFWRNVEGFF